MPRQNKRAGAGKNHAFLSPLQAQSCKSDQQEKKLSMKDAAIKKKMTKAEIPIETTLIPKVTRKVKNLLKMLLSDGGNRCNPAQLGAVSGEKGNDLMFTPH